MPINQLTNDQQSRLVPLDIFYLIMKNKMSVLSKKHADWLYHRYQNKFTDVAKTLTMLLNLQHKNSRKAFSFIQFYKKTNNFIDLCKKYENFANKNVLTSYEIALYVLTTTNFKKIQSILYRDKFIILNNDLNDLKSKKLFFSEDDILNNELKTLLRDLISYARISEELLLSGKKYNKVNFWNPAEDDYKSNKSTFRNVIRNARLEEAKIFLNAGIKFDDDISYDKNLSALPIDILDIVFVAAETSDKNYYHLFKEISQTVPNDFFALHFILNKSPNIKSPRIPCDLFPPLYKAVMDANFPLVKFLLQAGMSVAYCDWYGCNAIQVAFEYNKSISQRVAWFFPNRSHEEKYIKNFISREENHEEPLKKARKEIYDFLMKQEFSDELISHLLKNKNYSLMDFYLNDCYILVNKILENVTDLNKDNAIFLIEKMLNLAEQAENKLQICSSIIIIIDQFKSAFKITTYVSPIKNTYWLLGIFSKAEPSVLEKLEVLHHKVTSKILDISNNKSQLLLKN